MKFFAVAPVEDVRMSNCLKLCRSLVEEMMNEEAAAFDRAVMQKPWIILIVLNHERSHPRCYSTWFRLFMRLRDPTVNLILKKC